MFPMLMAFLASLWALLLACIAFVSRAVLLCGDALRVVFRLLSVIICVLRMLISAVEATAKLTCVISRLVPKLFHLFVSRLVIPTAHAVPRITRAAFQIAQRMTHCACGVARQSLARASHVCRFILSAAFMTKAYEKLRLGVVFASNLLARAITTLVTTSISVSLAPSVRCTSVPFAHLNGDANPVSELDAMVPPKMRSGQFVDRELLKHHVWSGSRTMDETVIVLTCHIKRENAFRSTRVKEMLGDANIPFREIDVSYEHHEVVRVAYLAISGETDLPQVFRQSSSGDSIEFIGGHDAIMYLNDLENLPDHIMAKWGIENLTTRFQGVKKPRSMMQEWEQAELQKFMRFRKDIFHKPISVHTKIFEPSPALSDRSAKWTDESKEEGGGVDVEWTTERECKLRRKYSDEPMDIDAMIEFSLNTFTKRESRFRHGRWSLAMDPSVLDILSQAWSPAQGPFWVDYKGVIA